MLSLNWKSQSQAGVEAAKQSEMDTLGVILSRLVDLNPADEGVIDALTHHKILQPSLFVRAWESADYTSKSDPTSKEAIAFVKKLKEEEPVWHGLDANAFLTGPGCALRSAPPSSPSLPLRCPLGCPHGACGGGDWVLCAWCYGFYCNNCGAPRTGLWPGCQFGGACRAVSPPPSPEVLGSLPAFFGPLADAVFPPPPAVPRSGAESLLRFAKAIKINHQSISEKAQAAAMAAAVVPKPLPGPYPGLSLGGPGDLAAASYITPPDRGLRPAGVTSHHGFGDVAGPYEGVPGAPFKARDSKEIIRENLLIANAGKRWPTSLKIESLWPLFCDALDAEVPSFPSIRDTHADAFSSKKPPPAAVTFSALFEWCLAAFHTCCGPLGRGVLVQFAGCGQASDEIYAREDNSGVNIRVGLTFVTVMSFFKYVVDLCLRGEADDDQSRTFVVRVTQKGGRMLGRRHPSEDRIFCSPGATLNEVILADLELPARAVKAAVLPAFGKGTGKGAGRSTPVPRSGPAGYAGAPRSAARKLEDSDLGGAVKKARFGDGEPRGHGKKAVVVGVDDAPGISIKDLGMNEGDDEPVEYDLESWGGNPRSKLACFAFIFDEKGCHNDECGFSHRPSIGFRERTKVRERKGWASSSAPARPNPRFRDDDDDDEA